MKDALQGREVYPGDAMLDLKPTLNDGARLHLVGKAGVREADGSSAHLSGKMLAERRPTRERLRKLGIAPPFLCIFEPRQA